MSTRCSLYRCDIPTLLAALTDAALVARWQQAVGEEQPSLADRPLLAHLKRLNQAAARLMTMGFDTLARQDRVTADALLTDLFAVATWHGWELPVVQVGDQELDVADLPRGFLGADTAEGAGLWLIEAGTVALARQRQAADEADWSSHIRAH